MICNADQMVHCGVYDSNGSLLFWMTTIYAQNHLEQRRKLWEDIEVMHNQQHGLWFLMGNFNNVLKSQDRIGRRIVTEYEYHYINVMMKVTNLFEMDNSGDHYTWSNMQSGGAIYFWIDKVLGNIDQLQKN